MGFLDSGDLFGGSDGVGGSDGGGPEPGCAYFFALRTIGHVNQEIGHRRESVIRALRAQRPSRVPDDRLHLSLCAPKTLKRLRAPFEDSLRRAGDDVVASAFNLRLHGLDRFHGGFDSSCIVLRSDEPTCGSVQLLKDAIGDSLFRHGFGWDRSALAPHVTLFYADGVEPPIDTDRAIDWHVDEFVLIRSWVGLHKHDTLATWSLH